MAKSLISVGALAGTLLLAGQLQAQGGPTSIEFSFANPGARSLGLGGAFAAIADDATASFANPAGLTLLTRPEVSLEGRYWSYVTPFTLGGRVSGEPTGIGLDGPIRLGASESDASSLSFVSFVYPGRNWVLALSRHQSARFETFTQTQGLFTDQQDDSRQTRCLHATDVCRYPDLQRWTNAEITTTTASFAYRLSDALSLGLGLSHFQGEIRLDQDVYLPVDETLPEGFFGRNAYVSDARFGSGDYRFEVADWGVNLGFLWFPNRHWSVGGFYRQGGEFSGSGVEVSGPALDPPIPEGTVGAAESGIPLKIPDVFGLGLAYRSKNGSWTSSLEWDRVLYSQIVGSLGTGELIGAADVRLDDANELRLGVEYAFRRWSPLMAIRGGIWSNPDHAFRFIKDDPLGRALLPEGEDDLHLALGFGIAFKSFQMDFGVDLSDLVDTAALSLVYQF
jgi:long-chain fatty acid transport protein